MHLAVSSPHEIYEIRPFASHVRKILRRCGERQDGAQIRETPTRSNTKNCGKRIKYRLIDVDRVGADGLTALRLDESACWCVFAMLIYLNLFLQFVCEATRQHL